MLGNSKLKGPVGRIYPIAILTVYIFALLEFFLRKQMINSGEDIIRAPIFSVVAAAAFFAGMGIYQFFRYKTWVYLALGILMGVCSLHSLGSAHVYPFTAEGYLLCVILLALLIVVKWNFLYGQERFEINSRRLFKLACDSISETSAGFTARPYYAGQIEHSNELIEGFSRFLKGKYITKPVYREQGIYLLFSLGNSLMNDPEPNQVSYILFDKSGQISVHISAYDYKQYTERFTFNQLCDSFAAMFRRFLEYYRDGHEERIIIELKSV